MSTSQAGIRPTASRSLANSPRGSRFAARRGRNGATLVLMAIVLVSLLAMVGLVIDAGILMSQANQAQSVADAAAVAAAHELLRGASITTARQTATNYISTYHSMAVPAAGDIRIPPTTGPFAGRTGYVEVIAHQNIETYFMRAIPGTAATYRVSGRAVAGYEAHTAGEGVMSLAPNVYPGLNVSGQGALRVNGRIIVNSEGGGEDQYGNPINNGNNGTAISAGQPNSETGIYAKWIQSVGGVDNSENFKPYYTGDPNPLRTGKLPEPDPLINLSPPTVSMGVDSRSRGSVSVTNLNATGINTDSANQNFIAKGGEVVAAGSHVATAGEVVLHPGVYNSIDITGGKVFMIPGIYVIRALKANQSCLKITGGNVLADGVMFYNTGSNYDVTTGYPDILDGNTPPPITDGAKLGGVSLNASLHLNPIDTDTYNYSNLYTGAQPVSDKYDGMLFFQRRRSTEIMSITGNAAEGTLTGTLYAKWAEVQITGQGTYDAQFVVGSMKITGQGDITILSSTGSERGKANDVYLVE